LITDLNFPYIQIISYILTESMAEYASQYLTTKDYSAISTSFSDDKPVIVIHLMRFNAVANYPVTSPHHPTRLGQKQRSGREAFFDHYLPAAQRAVVASAISPPTTHFFSTSVTSLLPHNDIPWDVSAVRQFSSFAAYTKYQTSQVYVEEAAPHRAAALADWTLVACVESNFPGREGPEIADGEQRAKEG
jgi:hypothetical protein